MPATYETDLYRRIHGELQSVPMTDCHEHLQRESELPTGDDIHIGRFFAHYANCDLVAAGMPAGDMARVQTNASLSPAERWGLLKSWYHTAWNTGYCEALRIAWRGIARVLCGKVEEGRFSESYAIEVGGMLLRDNAVENFGLERRRRDFAAQQQKR